jgi:hypothetical protein
MMQACYLASTTNNVREAGRILAEYPNDAVPQLDIPVNFLAEPYRTTNSHTAKHLVNSVNDPRGDYKTFNAIVDGHVPHDLFKVVEDNSNPDKACFTQSCIISDASE